MIKLVTDMYGDVHIYYSGIEQPQWLKKKVKRNWQRQEQKGKLNFGDIISSGMKRIN